MKRELAKLQAVDLPFFFLLILVSNNHKTIISPG
jgi:hypothetical protein